MAAILIVEADRHRARSLAHTMREAGHTPIIASDSGSALQATPDPVDLVLLDLRAPDPSRKELLQRLKSRPETAQIPVLVLTEQWPVVDQVGDPATEPPVNVVFTPVSGAQLCQAVDAALGPQSAPGTAASQPVQERQAQLIERIIVEGPEPLVFHTCRRLSLDRLGGRGSLSGQTLTWGEIAAWARRERLLDAEEEHLLGRIPRSRPRKTPERPA